MIFDNIKHIENYKNLGDVYKALEFLSSTDFSKMPAGDYPLNDKMYYKVVDLTTKENPLPESHKNYIDVQFLLFGEEAIGVADVNCDKEIAKSDPENDIWFYNCKVQYITLKPADFMVLYPTDIHAPGKTVTSPANCRKIVVKVKA